MDIFNGRTGKVANERPRTSLIQDKVHAMKVHFYIEANPIRANMYKFENLKVFKFSTFRYFAFGITDEYTKMIEVPQWYINLGRTPELRQRKYRSLFKKYLEELLMQCPWMWEKYIGDPFWCAEKDAELKGRSKKRRSKATDPP